MHDRDLSVPSPTFRLHLFGAVELHAPDGSEVTGIVSQPKRMALLAFLAASPAQRFHRRDSLVALFWPESDTEHARAALRRALHFLRRALGETTIRSRGDEIGLDRGIVWSDVGAFSDALAEGRLEAALDLYRGDLMQGFYVASAPDFERWMDDERRCLRKSAVATAWQLAERDERAGSERSAARWARRANALDPSDESGVRRLIELLDRIGDRISAVRVYEDFSRLVAAELQVEPAPETKALVGAVRRRSGVVAAPAQSSEERSPETAPNVIAVLPFAIRGSSELGYLREGIVDLFCAKLDGAGELRTVDPHTLLRYTQLHGSADLDPATARPIAERFQAGAFLLGTVVGAGGRIHVSATLYETDGSSKNSAEAETAHESEIFGIVDELVRTLLAQRITSYGGQIGRLAAMTTDSMPALKAYLAGERAFRRARCLDAIAEYERAVAEDPKFALGHYRLAEARAACGLANSAREASTAAWEERRRLAPHARVLLEAQRSWLDGSIWEAEALYRRLIGVRATDVEGWYHLGRLYFDYNGYRGRSAAEAKRAFQRVVALDHTHVAALTHLVRIGAMEGRKDEVGALVERILTLSPTGDQALAMRAVRAFLTQDAGAREEQEEVIAEVAEARAVTAVAAFADVALYACDLDGAFAVARRVDERTPPSAFGGFGLIRTAHLEFARGRPREAITFLRESSTPEQSAALQHQALLTALAAPSLDEVEVERTRDALRDWDPPCASPVPQAELPYADHDGLHAPLRSYLLGLLSARLGDADTALAYADECAAGEVSSDVAPMPRNLSLGVRARVACDRGDAAGAVRLLEQLSLGPWCLLAGTSPFYGLANERLLWAEALVRLGRHTEAIGWVTGLGQRSVFELAHRTAARTLIDAGEAP